jgi:hypothetical protein
MSYGFVTLFAGYWQPRYVLSLLAVSSAFAAVAVAEMLHWPGRLLDQRWTAAVALGLVMLMGAGAIRWQWMTSRELVRDLFRLDRREFLQSRGPFWKFAYWVNWNTMPEAKIGVGVNVQPYYYLDRAYFNIHPMTEKGNLQSLETPEEFLCAFRALGLDWLGFLRYRDEASYPKARTPHMHAFLRRLNRAVDALAQTGQITLLHRVSSVRVYRIVGSCPADDGAGRSSGDAPSGSSIPAGSGS